MKSSAPGTPEHAPPLASGGMGETPGALRASRSEGSELRRQCEAEIGRFIVEQLGEGFEEITCDTPLIRIGILDSLLIQSLLSFLEIRYSILLPAEEVRPETFGTIRDIAAVVERCAGGEYVADGSNAFEVLNRLMESYGLGRRWIERPGRRLHLLTCRGAKPTLFLLSGLGSPASSWGLLMRSLQGKREAVALDLGGFGVSDAPRDGDHSFAGHVGDAIAVLEAVAGGPAVLVGNSAGAMISAEVARRRPDLCRALIVISFGRVRDGEGWWRALRALSADVELFWRRAFHDPPPLNAGLRAQIESTLSSRAYQEFLDPAAIAGLDRLFAGVDVPAMFLGGMNDGIVDPAIVEEGAAQMPGARLEWIPRCGHYAHSERSEEVLVYLEHFLAGIEGRENGKRT